jgi:valine dehydrogenase (NAD+)
MDSTLSGPRLGGVGVFERDDHLDEAGHEQVVFCRDEATGLRAIIAIHDTTLGPALGGTRFFPYASEGEAVTDALRLSQGMTYKAAAAGLPCGGGKAVIIGDPSTVKTRELLLAFGRFVDSLGGRYVTAADVGTTSDDLDVVGESTAYVVGRNRAAGGSGDSGLSTAGGVLASMRAAAGRVWGASGLSGRVVGVEGAGKVGSHLVRLLLAEGAHVVLAEPLRAAREHAQSAYPEIRLADSVLDAPVDIYAPCALGATLNPETVPLLQAEIVCGAANNQLLGDDVDQMLSKRGVVWVPDFVANAGGLIQLAGELDGRSAAEVQEHLRAIADTVVEVLERADRDGVPPGLVALTLARERILAAGSG